jgi:hypothetical protein
MRNMMEVDHYSQQIVGQQACHLKSLTHKGANLKPAPHMHTSHLVENQWQTTPRSGCAASLRRFYCTATSIEEDFCSAYRAAALQHACCS